MTVTTEQILAEARAAAAINVARAALADWDARKPAPGGYVTDSSAPVFNQLLCAVHYSTRLAECVRMLLGEYPDLGTDTP